MARPTDRQTREIGRRISRSLVTHVGPGFGRPLLAAVSGGADSSAMLLALADTQSRHGWRVRAAHIDHAIQSESVRAEFLEAAGQVAAIADAPLDAVQADAISEAATSSDGLEAAARRVRYQTLVRLAQERGAPVIAVAHTRDDQAETVLIHMLRGSGLDGLSGMPATRELSDGVRLARPLLGVTRAETESVCQAYGWQPVDDPSNEQLEYTRNRVRRSLLPLMQEINPNISERLAQLAQSVSSDRALLELIGRQALEQLRDGSGALSRRSFLALPEQLQNRVLRTLCREHGANLSSERTASAIRVIRAGHGVIELPGGRRLSIADGTIELRGVIHRP